MSAPAAHAPDQSCCPAGEGEPEVPFEDLLDDPTMAQCCIRDMKQQRKSAALRAQLQRVDVSTARQKLQQRVVAAAAPADAAADRDESSDFGDGDDEGDADPELAQLRELRLQQMKLEAGAREQLQRHGHGKLNEHQAAAAYELLMEKDCPAICHVAVPGLPACEQLDEYLEGQAHLHQGVYFCRAAAPRGCKLGQQLGLEALPALVCLKSGGIIGRAPLSMFGTADELYEEQVDSYLRRIGVLASAPRRRGADTGAGAGGGSSDEGSGQEEEVSDWQAPCEVCGRRYPHQHVKAVYQSSYVAGDGSDGGGSD